MKHIIKKYTAPDEPQALIDFKNRWKKELQKGNYKNVYDNFKAKKEPKNIIKQQLIEEQHYICCYCQQRIAFDEKTQIEHLIPRAVDATKMFDYDNLLACCKGGEAERQADKNFPTYCGASKSGNLIAINPLQTDCESFFEYEVSRIKANKLSVKIIGKTPEAENTVQTLNLNCSFLQEQRGAIYDVYFQNATAEELQVLQQALQNTNRLQYAPFEAMLAYFLENILNKSN